MKTYDALGLAVPEILLPRSNVAPERWAVIACDQYTSQPDYWRRADDVVGGAPSTLSMIYPEVFLGEPEPAARIQRICKAMQDHLDAGLFEAREEFVYVERRIGGKTRRGLVVALDLEAYDYNAGSTSLIRATEGTIVSRLPPRIEVRKDAPLELPHIMVLIDDPDDSVIGPIAASKSSLDKRYDFDLMLDGGHLCGWSVTDTDRAAAALETLAAPPRFAEKYGVPSDTAPLLFAMGDGNHSLATAKAIWEGVKKDANPDDPRRWALVELVNLHDDAMVFEPIHRVLFEANDSVVEALHGQFEIEATARDDAISAVDAGGAQRFGLVSQGGWAIGTVREQTSNLTVGSLQPVLDALVSEGRAKEIDYVHGTDALEQLGAKPGNVGLFLPGMDKNDLFKTVILDGALPRKTFSMGEADEKRFYMECRRITA